MRSNNTRHRILVSLFILINISLIPCFAKDNTHQFKQFKAAIQISSVISEGEYSLEEIVRIAKEKGFSVVIPTDRDVMRWEYGLFPLRNVIKKRIEHNSVFRYGIGSYLKDIKSLQNEFPQTVILPGVESAPFYYWSGSLKDGLTLHNWHKHILAIGLNDYSVYRKLPVIGNRGGLEKGFNVLKLWPLVFLVISLWLVLNTVKSSQRGRGRYYPIAIVVEVIVFLLSSFFLLNNFPFRDVFFDQYQGDLKSIPYQNFIDYVDANQGLTFWAHPEAENKGKRGRVSFITPSYPYDLVNTQRYTGFCVFYEGYRLVGKIGGIWDKLLSDYCEGKRKKPVWAIGCLGFERGDLSSALDDLYTVILSKENSFKAILNALSKGGVYVIRGSNSQYFSLREFYIFDKKNKDRRGFVGEKIKVKIPIIYLKGGWEKIFKEKATLEIRLIKKGELIYSQKNEDKLDLLYEDKTFTKLNRGENTYYRVEIVSRGLHFLTNPIFVEKE